MSALDVTLHSPPPLNVVSLIGLELATMARLGVSGEGHHAFLISAHILDQIQIRACRVRCLLTEPFPKTPRWLTFLSQ